jgi:hypothetical protein
MSRKVVVPVFVTVFILAVVSSYVQAADSFSIAPPPIVAPTFEEGKTEGKARFTYLSMKGNGMDFIGGGVDVIGRKAFSGDLAGDGQAGLFVLGGDIDAGGATKSTLTFMNMLFGVNGEYLAHKGDTFSTLLFAGPNMTFMFGSYDYTYGCGVTTTCTDTATLTGYLFGLQAGIQFGINAGDFSIDPFAMAATQSGSMTTSTSFSDNTVTIDSFTTTSFGVDITYKPWNMSLSAILQEAAKQKDDKEGMKTTIYQISWRF